MSLLFHAETTPLPGVTVITRKHQDDKRGSFERLFCQRELEEYGWRGSLTQLNRSCTRARGSVRGMHFQYPPQAEIKLILCLKGSIFDVAVDVRHGSETFLKSHGEVLDETGHKAVLISPGFAHGFQTLTNDVEMIYCHSAPYAPSAESGLHPCDPVLNIRWPEPITTMSDRDRDHSYINSDFTGVCL